MATAYVVAGTRDGFWSRSVDSRFEPSGLRGLPRAAGQVVPALLVLNDTGAATLGLRPVRGGIRAPRLGRALRAVDSLGVDALFEDSAALARRLADSLAGDVAAARSGAAPDLFGAPRLMQTSTCPEWTALRSGTLTFFNNNTDLNEPLPNALIEARDAHPLIGGSLVNLFRTGTNGSFSACLPYDGNGYTYISVFQDTGPVRVLRDSGEVKHVFPNRYGMAWDLAVPGSLPLTTGHNEISFILLTWYKGVTEATRLFGITREQLTSWYYTNADGDYWCPLGVQPNPFWECTHFGENIYTHQFSEAGQDNIWRPRAQFTRMHEYGHGFEYRLLSDRLANGGCGKSHSFTQPDDLDCAANEGWADFFAAITLPILQDVNGASVSQEVSVFGMETWHTPAGQTRGPEIEGSFAAYLFDLVDGAGVPWFRYYSTDDDNAQVPFAYLVQVLRDGKVQSPYEQHIQDVIAIVDDVTPVPYKSEFAGYGQPTSLTTRVTPPTSLTAAAHRYIWRFDIFGLTGSNPLVVTASAPYLVTVKSVQDLYGSASGGTGGGYAGWTWERSYDCPNCWEFWSNYQNSQFVAYAGNYTLEWRLTARDGGFNYDSDQATTAVCIPYNAETCNGMPAARFIAGAPGGAVVPTGMHFGSGVWLSREGDTTATQLYSLVGRHDEWMRSDGWPNSLEAATGTRSRNLALSGRVVRLMETVALAAGGVRMVRVTAEQLEPGASYRLSFAVDPDLGVTPSDDRLTWSGALGVAVVRDPRGDAMAYGWAGAAGQRALLREYGQGRAEPRSSRDAYLEQRDSSAVLGTPGDVRFTMTAPSLIADARGTINALFIAAGGADSGAALDALNSARIAAGSSLALADTFHEPGEGLIVRQFLRSELVGLGLARQQDGLLASLAGGATGASASDVAQVRAAGITAVAFALRAPTSATRVRVTVLDSRGTVVRRAVDESLATGDYVYRWDGTRESGARVPPGVYQVIVEAGAHRQRTILVLTR